MHRITLSLHPIPVGLELTALSFCRIQEELQYSEYCSENGTQSDTSALTSQYIFHLQGLYSLEGPPSRNDLGAACRVTAKPPWSFGCCLAQWELTGDLPVAGTSQSSCKFNSKRRFRQFGQTLCC